MSVDTQNQVNNKSSEDVFDNGPPPLIVDGEIQPVLSEETEKGEHETQGMIK